jgi:hypothetical protein
LERRKRFFRIGGLLDVLRFRSLRLIPVAADHFLEKSDTGQ